MRAAGDYSPSIFAYFFALVLACTSFSGASQTTAPNEWTWVGGVSTGVENPVTGTLGVQAAGNIPGQRYGATTWTDKKGNFWLFGGNPGPAIWFPTNDLWKFNPSTGEWAWMSGSPTGTPNGVYGTMGAASAGNVPGARSDSAGWTDSKGNLWLFGGWGMDASGIQGVLNDLWEFTPSTGQWTWMSGSTTIGNSCFSFDIASSVCAEPSVYGTLGTAAAGNTPGSREGATTWTDNKGNMWLFGGWSFDVSVQTQYYYDELWEYSPSTNLWAWMGGSSTRDGSSCTWNVNLWYLTCGEPGVYGTMGTPSPENIPGGRAGGTGWTDSQGNLWLFSGNGFDINGYLGDPNDLWEFNSSSGQWTWMGGINAITEVGCGGWDCSAPAVYGSLGTPAADNIPLGRDHAVGFKDNDGNLWLFGGGGLTVFSYPAPDFQMNDLWKFNPVSSEWTLMGGSITELCSIFCSAQAEALYGVQGTPAVGDNPGPRYAPAGWTDSGGNFWLFGGDRETQGLSAGPDNDLWEYQPSSNLLPTTATPIFSVPAGSYSSPQGVTIGDATNGAFIFYTTDGTTPTSDSDWFPSNSALPINIEYSQTLKAIAFGSGSLASDVASAVYTLPPRAATPTFSLPTGTYTSFQTVTISDAIPGATIYYTTDQTTPTTNSKVYSGPITVISAYMPLQAVAIANGYSISPTAIANYTLNLPYTTAPTFSVGSGTYTTPQTVTISDAISGATIYYQINTGYPTTSSPVYTGPISVSSSETIYAMATANNYFPSGYTGVTYSINPLATQTAAPVFSVPSGTYAAPQTVSISDATSGASIYYTTDGTTPNTSSTYYFAPITVSSSETLQAIAVASGDTISAVAGATYVLNLPQAATPTLSVPSGTYTAAQTVSISDSISGAAIYYTTNGTTPTANSTLYTSPIIVAATETLQAIAIAAGYTNSAIASASYTVNLPAPDFSITAGSSSLTVAAGQSATTTISVEPLNGFNSAVSFSCSGLPSGASCSFAPPSVTPSGVLISTALTVSTSASSAKIDHGRGLFFSGSALAFALCLFGRKKWRGLMLSLLLLACVIEAGLLNGCGGGSAGAGGGSGPISSTSAVTVIAASGQLQHTTTFSLTVN
jgi:N-acetylneuraminic acid mutarotase